MYKDDYYDQEDLVYNDSDRLDKILEESKKVDRGHNNICIKVQKRDGTLKRKKIDVYTSSGVGSRIRDAETGEYYPNIVGSKDEDLFYKVNWATGECNSSNGSSIMFYISPQHFINHTNSKVSDKEISSWESKRNARLMEIEKMPKRNANSVVVK